MTTRNQPTLVKILGVPQDRDYVVEKLQELGFRDKFLAPHVTYIDEQIAKARRAEVFLVNAASTPVMAVEVSIAS